jgi:DNA-binding CsgD family transcriptional regulator
MQLHLEKLSELTYSFYEAAAEPSQWVPTLEKASTVFGADGSCIVAFPSSAIGAVWSSGLDELAQSFFGEGWHENNERLARALPMRNSRPVMTESDLFSPEELDRHPFNSEFINAHGFRWGAGCFLSEVDGWNTAFTVERHANRERYGSAEIEAMRSILPHMRSAAQVASRLALARGDGMLDAFEKMCCAAILLGCTGKVHRYNAQTERYLGRDIRIVQGCLTSCHKDSNAALQRVIGGVLGAPHRLPTHNQTLAAIARRNPPDGRPFFALGMPIIGAAQDVFQNAKAILLLIDPDAQSTPPELILRHGFSLTRAEVRLTLALARGETLSEYAGAHGIAVGTARIQLKAIMAKTGTHRQAELLALLARLSLVPPQVAAE